MSRGDRSYSSKWFSQNSEEAKKQIIGEVDFLVVKDGKELPIEAKSGRHYRSHAALDRLLAQRGYGIQRALVLSTGNTDRVSPIDYLPAYMIMFLDHDGLPPNLTYPKPSLDLSVSPHFKNRSRAEHPH